MSDEGKSHGETSTDGVAATPVDQAAAAAQLAASHARKGAAFAAKSASDLYDSYHAKDTLTVTLNVPTEGDEVVVKVPDGRELTFAVPPGLSPGDEFEQEYESLSAHETVLKGASVAGAKTVEAATYAKDKSVHAAKALHAHFIRKDTLACTLTVPDDSKEGEEFEIMVPDGRKLTVVVPLGKKAGDNFEFQYESLSYQDHVARNAMAANDKMKSLGRRLSSHADGALKSRSKLSITVTVPAESKEAGPIFVQVPDGRKFEINAPAGKSPGDTFEFEYEGLSAEDHVEKHTKVLIASFKSGQADMEKQFAKTHKAFTKRDILTMDTVVPAENKAGDEITVTVPDGRVVKVPVPDGKGPGDTFEFQYEGMSYHDHATALTNKAKAYADGAGKQANALANTIHEESKKILSHKTLLTYSTYVPHGKAPGDRLSVKVPDGRKIDCVIPDGKEPGMTFEFQYESRNFFDFFNHATSAVQKDIDTHAENFKKATGYTNDGHGLKKIESPSTDVAPEGKEGEPRIDI